MSVFASDQGATVIKANKAEVKIDNATSLALNVQIQFQRNVEVLDTVGKDRVIAVGEPKGTFTIEQIIGHDKIAALEESGCTPISVSITTADECGGTSEVTCGNCVLSATSITAQGGRGYIAHGVQGVFTKLTIA